MKGLGGIMKQAQQMQEKLTAAQDELASIEVQGASGGDMVKVTMTCKHDVKRINIDPGLMADDKEIIEDMVAAAVNDAVRKVEKITQEKMAGLTSGINIPGLNLPL